MTKLTPAQQLKKIEDYLNEYSKSQNIPTRQFRDLSPLEHFLCLKLVWLEQQKDEERICLIQDNPPRNGMWNHSKSEDD